MIKKLKKTNQKYQIDLSKSNKVDLYLGHSKNHLQIKLISPWLNFKDKDEHLTQKPYLILPQKFPQNPRARRIITEAEIILIGKIYWPKLFGVKTTSKTIAPQHLKLEMKNSKITITQTQEKFWTRINYELNNQ